MQYSKVSDFIHHKLQNELPQHLTYHNDAHTSRVTEVVMQLAVDEGVSEEEKTILATAALFHDAGFLSGAAENHEDRSCDIAREYLPAFEYSAQQIEMICDLIKATKNPQLPNNKLECIICDADLSYLGTDSYTTISGNLYKELKVLQNVPVIEMWEQKQIQFLKSHRYFTPSATRRFAPKGAEPENSFKKL